MRVSRVFGCDGWRATRHGIEAQVSSLLVYITGLEGTYNISDVKYIAATTAGATAIRVSRSVIRLQRACFPKIWVSQSRRLDFASCSSTECAMTYYPRFASHIRVVRFIAHLDLYISSVSEFKLVTLSLSLSFSLRFLLRKLPPFDRTGSNVHVHQQLAQLSPASE